LKREDQVNFKALLSEEEGEPLGYFLIQVRRIISANDFS
jgi:hypothetical protein